MFEVSWPSVHWHSGWLEMQAYGRAGNIDRVLQAFMARSCVRRYALKEWEAPSFPNLIHRVVILKSLSSRVIRDSFTDSWFILWFFIRYSATWFVIRLVICDSLRSRVIRYLICIYIYIGDLWFVICLVIRDSLLSHVICDSLRISWFLIRDSFRDSWFLIRYLAEQICDSFYDSSFVIGIAVFVVCDSNRWDPWPWARIRDSWFQNPVLELPRIRSRFTTRTTCTCTGERVRS